MKKTILGFVLLVAMTTTVTTGCSKKDCAALQLDALEKLELEDFFERCNGYKEAQLKYINSCLSGEAKDAALEDLADFGDCEL